MDSTTTPTLPRLNEPAPDFEAVTTQGPIKLSDFKGKWVVHFSHPAGFTPANWQPGEKVIVPPPLTQSAAEERVQSGEEVVDWYFTRKELKQ